MIRRSFLLALFLLLQSGISFGQDTLLTLVDIQIKGNKKTKESVILRELNFQLGEKLLAQNVAAVAKLNENLVMNTGLFTAVDVSFERITATEVEAVVEVREFWYLFPIAIFQLADRNFSIWWSEQNRSLERVNYGMRFYHDNLTGRGDRFRVFTQLGYLKLLQLAYDLPMFRGSKNWGIFFDAHFSNQKEVAYITQESRLQFFSQADESVLLRRFRLGAGTTYREGIFKYHTFKLLYSDNWVGDSISLLNPDYFLGGISRQQHFTFQYDFTIDKRDIKAYPISGYIFSAFAQKDGFQFQHEDVNVFSTSLSYAHFLALGKEKKHSFGAKIKGRYTWNRQEQAYTHVSAVGYSPDVLKGYEFYVIDGMDYLYLKTHLVFSLLKKEINFGKWVFLEQFRHMPIQVYFTINSDWGYVNAPYNESKSTLSNQWLWGRGLGIDILMYYDKLMRFEYSFNHLGERGLFFSWDLAF
ncbi:MAG: POTRA domain-containing protein [Bacteroidota bacterium]